MKCKRIFVLLVVGLLFSATQIFATSDTLSWYEGSITSYGGFPHVQGNSVYDETSFMITPTADGILQEFGFLTFFNGFEYPTGVMQVSVYSNVWQDDQAVPGEPLTGTLQFSGTDFSFSPEWTYLDLSALGFTFTADEQFQLVWEYIPSGTEHLNLLLTDPPNLVSGMHLLNQDSWGHWFNNAGDPLETVVVEYNENPPASLIITPHFLDMGLVETETTLSAEINLTNGGGEALTITGMTNSNPGHFQMLDVDFPLILDVGESVDIQVNYSSVYPIVQDSVSLVFSNDGSPLVTETVCNLVAGASAADYLTNQWAEDEDEPVWLQMQMGDEGETWALYEGFNRAPWFAGQEFSTPTILVNNLLFTVLPNPGEYPLSIQFVQNQLFPEDTEFHSLFVGHMNGDTLVQDYEAVLWDESDPAHQDSSLLVWDNSWHGIHMNSVDMPYQDVVVGFQYQGEYADSWYVDDVETDFLTPPMIDIALAAGAQVRIHWQPIPVGTIHVYSASDPDGEFTEITQVPASQGEYFDTLSNRRFYRVTYDDGGRNHGLNLRPARNTILLDDASAVIHSRTGNRQVVKPMP